MSKPDHEELFQQLDRIRKEIDTARKVYEHDNDTWWEGLTEQEREDAFYAVTKRIYRAEVKEQGTYRYALYDVFGFDSSMYGRGMDCGYLNLHNIIGDGLELDEMKGVNRFEVIDDDGRTYVKHFSDDQRIEFKLQDDNKTLKVFITGSLT